jgi:hypothetical protein
MSDMHEAPEGELTVADGVRPWAIYRCGHGCLHVTLDRLMLTFTEGEFHAFRDLMRRAGEHMLRADSAAADSRLH